MSIIKNITNNYPTTRRAAMYYKTEPFYVNVDAYVHTNNWEILQSIKILNQKGYSVDLIDRGVSSWKPTEKYDLFLGLGVGNAGINFPRHAKASGADIKIILSMGPQPDVSTDLVEKRYKIFNERNNLNVPSMRAPTKVTGAAWKEIVDSTDYIFNIGEPGTESYNSFLPYKKPILNFYPSISPKVNFNEDWLNTRDLNSFLCFAGNGFICKGVDLVVEAFLNQPDKTLHICGPSTERAFFQRYQRDIQEAPNIKYHGFIEPGGDVFNAIASKCAFVVSHSAAESCCTAVATTMKAGLVPLVNKWTSINITNEGFIMPEEGDLVSIVAETVNKASNLSHQEYNNMVQNLLKKVTIFSQDSFIESYTQALSDVIENAKI